MNTIKVDDKFVRDCRAMAEPVLKMLKRKSERVRGLGTEELNSIVDEVAMSVPKDFDEGRGNLKGFISSRVIWATMNRLSETSDGAFTLSQHLVEKRSRLQQEVDEFIAKHGRPPTIKDWRGDKRDTTGEANRALLQSSNIHLDMDEVADVIADPNTPNPEQEVIDGMMLAKVRDWLDANCTQVQRDAFVAHATGLDTASLMDKHHLSRQRLHQIYQKVRSRLQEAFA